MFDDSFPWCVTTPAQATAATTKQLQFDSHRLSADPLCHAQHNIYLMVWYMFCRRGLLAIRGCFGFGAIGCYFFAVTLLPLNDAMVITFLAPLVVALASPVVIKESPPK